MAKMNSWTLTLTVTALLLAAGSAIAQDIRTIEFLLDRSAETNTAPDESSILFYRVFNRVPSAYASFKRSDGQWLPAIKFGLPWGAGGGRIVSPDGKYLFYGSNWKSARFLDDLRRQAEAAAEDQEDGHGR